MVRALVAAIVCAACQGQPASQGQAPGSGSAGAQRDAAPPPADAPVAPPAGDAGSAAAATGERGGSEEPDVPDPGRVIAELGAIPPWQAVVDRADLLARRGQHGVVYGRVGPVVMVPAPPPLPLPPPSGPAAGSAAAPVIPGAGAGAAAGAGVSAAAGAGAAAKTGAGPAATAGAGVVAKIGAGPAATAGAGVVAKTGAGPAATARAGAGAAARPAAPAAPDAGLVASPYVWLIDDTDGNGALGIRIALGGKAKEGDRIAAGGAWQLDAERRWFWKPDAIQPLPPAPPSDVKDPPPAAPGHAIATGALPAGARTASVARDNDAIYFQIVGPPPTSEGDGWQIADQLGSPTALVINLPGERASYGGQDMRAADERWQLRRGQTYWVRIGRLHKRAGKPTQVNARTAPIRVM